MSHESSSDCSAELQSLFRAWKLEHEQLLQQVDDLFDSLVKQSWKDDESRSQIQSHSTSELRLLADRLKEHFSKETRIGLLLELARGRATHEVASMREKAEHEHRQLMDRLQSEIKTITSAEIGTEEWKSAIQSFGLFVDALEQHEDEEADNVSWLMPK